MGHRHLFLRTLTLALLAWLSCAQPSCPDLAMKVRVNKAAALGGAVTVRAKVDNAGPARQEDVAIGIILPDALWSPVRPVATALKQPGRSVVSPKYQAPGVYWLRVSVPMRKNVKVRVKARVAACPALVGTTLAFTGIVYKTNATGQVICATAATGRRNATRIKPSIGHSRTLPPSACSTPTPAPGTPYVLVAEDQQILGAENTPFLGGRRRVLTPKEGTSVSAAIDRELPAQQYTAQDCYEACSFSGKYVTPFYMSFYEPPGGTAECYCSQTKLRMAYTPSSTVYRIDTEATAVGDAPNACAACLFTFHFAEPGGLTCSMPHGTHNPADAYADAETTQQQYSRDPRQCRRCPHPYRSNGWSGPARGLATGSQWRPRRTGPGSLRG